MTLKREIHQAAVVGEGWSALATVGTLVHAGIEVTWVPGSAARVLAPLPILEKGEGAEAWQSLAAVFGIETGGLKPGQFLREYRNKAFRPPVWNKSATPEDRAAVHEEVLWKPESRFVPVWETRFESCAVADIEEALRKELLAHPKVRRIQEAPIRGLQGASEERRCSLVLGSGETLSFDAIFYADRWSLLPGLEGMPKPIPFLRGRNSCGVLQAVYTYDAPIAWAAETQEGFFQSAHRDAGETLERSVWGGFFDGGRKSVWTLLLTGEEVEDNHTIAKKLRRLKQGVGRMFSGPGLALQGEASSENTEVAAGAGDEASLVLSGRETVSFEESLLFSSGTPVEKPLKLAGIEGIYFLTDGYGPAAAFAQVKRGMSEFFGLNLSSSETLPSEEARESISEGTAPSLSELHLSEVQF